MKHSIRTFLDTSVLVPSLEIGHFHYEAAAIYFDAAARRERQLLVSAHALMETYATLTALPVKPRIAPKTAARLIRDSVLTYADTVILSEDDYVDVINRVAQLGLSSGAIYDALHVRAAEKSGAVELVTFNGRDFRRMPPEAPCRLVVLE